MPTTVPPQPLITSTPMTLPWHGSSVEPAALIGRTANLVLLDGATHPEALIRGYSAHTGLLVLGLHPATGGSVPRMHTIDVTESVAAFLSISARPPAPLMQVTIRDRAAEAPWGSGPTRPRTRSLTVVATCPSCGGPRGEPQGLRQYDDGEHYWVTTWTNDCGHPDPYRAITIEAGLRRSPYRTPLA